MLFKNNHLKKHVSFILKGSISQNNKAFDSSSNSQCTAICAYAIAFSSVCSIQDWDQKILDRIIEEGNNYYNSCQFILRQKDIIFTPFLAVDEILGEIELDNKILKISQFLDMEFDNTRQGNLLRNDLVKHIEEFLIFFNDCENLLLILKCFTFSIIKHLDYVYLVDSHEHFESNAYVMKIHKNMAAEEINRHLISLFPLLDNYTYTISFIKIFEKNKI